MQTHAAEKRTAVHQSPTRAARPHAAQPVAVRNILRQPRLQAKLKIGAANDRYEQEADRVADQVMRMPEPMAGPEATAATLPANPSPSLDAGSESIQRICAGCEEELQRKTADEEEELQRKEAPGAAPALSASSEGAIRGLSGGGAPLPASERAFFEPRFGQDFSGVRIHTGAAADANAKSINARAFTLGSDIAFGKGEYAPGSAPGRRLLAHELSHTVQQGAVPQWPTQVGSDVAAPAPTQCVPPVVQRKMKFEFQTRNVLWRRKGKKARLLAHTTHRSMRGRKFGPKDYLRKGKGKKGTELQTDTGGVIEFETDGWFGKWSKIKAHIEEAVDMVKKIEDRRNLIDPKKLPADQRSNPRYSWPWKKHQKGAQLNKKTNRWMDSLRKGETLEVEVKDEKWFAAIQSSEEIDLSQYESLLREHEWRSSKKDRYIEPTIKSAQNILKKVNKGALPVNALVNLRSLLEIIVNYIKRGQRLEKDRVVKATFRLMSRTSFSSMYRLLDPIEKVLFQLIVERKMILQELDLNENAKVFRKGIKGKVSRVTVHAWLKSIFNPRAYVFKKSKKIWLRDKKGRRVKRDLLSHGRFGVSHAMGASDVDPKKRTVRFEVRGTRSPRQGVKRHKSLRTGKLRSIRSQPMKHWVDYAESIFAEAFECRGTRLDYDQSDKERREKFIPSKCS